MQYKDTILPPLILSAGLVFLLILGVSMNQSLMDKRAFWDWEQYLANDSLFRWDFSEPEGLWGGQRNDVAGGVFDESGLRLVSKDGDVYFWLNMRDRLLDPKAYEFASIQYELEKDVKFQIFVEDIYGDLYGSSFEVLPAGETLKDMDLLAMTWVDVYDKENRIDWSEMKPVKRVRIDPVDQQGVEILLKSFALLKGFEFIDTRWFEAGELPEQQILGEFCVFQSADKLLLPEVALLKARKSRLLCPNSVYFSSKVNVDALLEGDVKAEADVKLPRLEKRTLVAGLLLVLGLAFAAGMLAFPLLRVASLVVSSIAIWLLAPLGYMTATAVAVCCIVAVALAEKEKRFLDEYGWGFGRAPSGLGRLMVMVTLALLLLACAMPGVFKVDLAANWQEGKHYFLHYPLWVVFQQLLMGPLIASLLYKSVGNDKNLRLTVASVVAVIFAGLHLPNTALVLLTLPMGFLWVYAWLRYQCIWPQILSHMVLGTALALMAPTDIRVWGEVGFMYFSYYW